MYALQLSHQVIRWNEVDLHEAQLTNWPRAPGTPWHVQCALPFSMFVAAEFCVSSPSRTVIRTPEVQPVFWSEQGHSDFAAPLIAGSLGGNDAQRLVLLSHVMEALG